MSNPEPSPAGATTTLPQDATPLEVFFKGNRPLAAGVLLLFLLIIPSTGLALALREGGGVWLVLALILMGGAILPPVGVLLGQRWGYILGQYVVWATLVGLILRALQLGFTPIYLGPAVLLGVLLVSLSPPKAQGETCRTEKKPESFGVWLKENLEAIAIAFIMALVIRCFCIEVFKIPSSSMEPTLLGDISETHSRLSCPFRDYHVPPNDSATGDRIMVTKYFYAFSPIERYDVLVFKFPLNQAKNFIKRVVGLPDEYLKIHRGNLYTSDARDAVYTIARRNWRTQSSIWIDPAKETNGYLNKREDFEGSWRAEATHDRKTPPGRSLKDSYSIQEGELSTQEVSGERSLQFVYKNRFLDDSGAPSLPVDDMRIAFEFEITSPKGQVFAEIVNAYGRFEARLDTEGASELWYHKPGSEKEVQPTTKALLKDVTLQADKPYKLELAIFDGIAYVYVNDGERGKIPFITTLEKDKFLENENPDRKIAFGARGVTFRAKKLSLGRDIYYRGKTNIHDDDPVHIGKGQYLMMGDNVANSHDSRAWTKRTFRLTGDRTVVCEQQQINEGYSIFNKHLRDKLGLAEPPDIGIDGDEHGNEVAINRKEIVKEDPPEPFSFVDEKFIVGKALWIWWPQGRWFHLIR